MPDNPDDRKVYDEKAVTAILRRATELQASSRPDGGFGLSLAELHQIAADAGIDPRFVSLAASEFVHPVEPETNWWGGPLSFSFEWMADGELDDVAWEEIVAETRRYFKDTGEVRAWSNSREWAHSGQNNVQAYVTATSREGMTRIQLFWSEPTLAVAAYIPLLVLSMIFIPIVFEALSLSGLLGAAVYFSGVGLLFFAARWFMTFLSSGKKEDLAELKTRLETIAAGRTARTGDAPPIAEDERPQPALGDEWESQEPQPSHRSRERL